jgi:hypothetical protein
MLPPKHKNTKDRQENFKIGFELLQVKELKYAELTLIKKML